MCRKMFMHVKKRKLFLNMKFLKININHLCYMNKSWETIILK